jgi:putative transposase
MRKRYTAKQKAQIVLEILQEEKTITQIASEYGIHPNQLHRWKKQALEGFPKVFEHDTKAERQKDAAHERQLKELYAEIGRLTTQLNWLKKKSGLDLL